MGMLYSTYFLYNNTLGNFSDKFYNNYFLNSKDIKWTKASGNRVNREVSPWKISFEFKNLNE